MNKLVSIVTTLYNYRNYIGDLIESALNQFYVNWELIIVDDGSTDDPLEVIQPYLSDERIIYIASKKNQGYSVAKNVGIKNTKGNYIVMIDADDMLTCNSIGCRKEALDKHPEKLWCHGEVLVVRNAESQPSQESIIWKTNFRKKLIREGMDLTKTYHHRLIHAQSVMVRPELHKKIGLYDENLRFSSDNEMWRRVIRFGYIPVHITDFVAKYRVHPDRMSRSKFKKDRSGPMKKKIIADVEKRFQEGINKNNTKLWK